MLPLILAAVGGYLIADSTKSESTKYEDGGMFSDVMLFEQFKKELPEIKNPFWGEEAIYKAKFDSYYGKIAYFKGGRSNSNRMSLADAYAAYLYQTYHIDVKRLPEEEKKRLFGNDAKFYKMAHGGVMQAEMVSNCCSVKAKTEEDLLAEMCSKCKEHCEYVIVDEDISDEIKRNNYGKGGVANGVELIVHGKSRQYSLGTFKSVAAAKRYVKESDLQQPYTIKKMD